MYLSSIYKKTIGISLFLALIFSSSIFAHISLLEKQANKNSSEVILIHNMELPKSQKEAILILPGLQDSKKGRKHQTARFSHKDYDLYIPAYTDKDSYAGTVEKLGSFYYEKELDQYAKVHVLSYILGSWVLNSFLHQNRPSNIASIVYDRSPLQERAPRLLAEKFKWFGKRMYGQVAIDLAAVPYQPIEPQDIKIGILVESRATLPVKVFKKKILSYGPIDWQNLDFQQAPDDIMFIPLNHAEMYKKLEVVDQDVLAFFKTGKFTQNARRKPFTWNPFKKPDKVEYSN